MEAFAEAYETQLNRFFTWADTNPESALFGLNDAVQAIQDADAGAPNGDPVGGGTDDPLGDGGNAAPEPDAGSVEGTSGEGDDAGSGEAFVYDAMFAYDYVESVLYEGVSVNGEMLPPSLMSSIAISLLREGEWGYLSVAIVSGIAGDWETVLAIADELGFFDESPEAHHDNQAFYAVSALDWECPADYDLQQAEERAFDLVDRFPRMGMGYATSAAECLGFSVPEPEPHLITSDVEAPPMLIMGGLYDPATPYVNAVQLTQLLNNDSLLLTSSAEGHGAGFTSACGTDAVRAFIADADISALPSQCSAEQSISSASLKRVVRPGFVRHRALPGR
jgi:hypothetical protein